MPPRRRRVQVGVTFKGPFFEKDPLLTMDQNIKRVMDEVAAFGERDVKARMAGIGTGRTAGHVRGRTESLVGKSWRYNAVVSVDTSGLPAKEAISVMAAAAEMERRVHPFRRAAADTRKFRRELQTELLKGLT